MNRLNENDFWDGAGAFGAVKAAVAALLCLSRRARLKMSRQEVKEEFKQSEGDPHRKGRIMQLLVARMKERMMAGPKASGIITNPHYSGAL